MPPPPTLPSGGALTRATPAPRAPRSPRAGRAEGSRRARGARGGSVNGSRARSSAHVTPVAGSADDRGAWGRRRARLLARCSTEMSPQGCRPLPPERARRAAARSLAGGRQRPGATAGRRGLAYRPRPGLRRPPRPGRRRLRAAAEGAGGGGGGDFGASRLRCSPRPRRPSGAGGASPAQVGGSGRANFCEDRCCGWGNKVCCPPVGSGGGRVGRKEVKTGRGAVRANALQPGA